MSLTLPRLWSLKEFKTQKQKTVTKENKQTKIPLLCQQYGSEITELVSMAVRKDIRELGLCAYRIRK